MQALAKGTSEKGKGQPAGRPFRKTSNGSRLVVAAAVVVVFVTIAMTFTITMAAVAIAVAVIVAAVAAFLIPVVVLAMTLMAVLAILLLGIARGAVIGMRHDRKCETHSGDKKHCFFHFKSLLLTRLSDHGKAKWGLRPEKDPSCGKGVCVLDELTRRTPKNRPLFRLLICKETICFLRLHSRYENEKENWLLFLDCASPDGRGSLTGRPER
ncbi:hypothetical protein [Acetobacter conturbans]|uniref:Uncharacterized protein n=1 Tax=Acetobacter conturbans TaxID=1737472 RepID=A0ABX0JY36_9PROT|nr:hypothetical protein [Acetobacter conturbans]NHN88274.1 hypothetical protein [Acetobacter conturbans]